jgi:SAM-dependent methyltransferase
MGEAQQGNRFIPDPAGRVGHMCTERSNWVETMSRANPEFRLGLFAYDDQIVDFYLRANSLLPEGGTVVELGAGRGRNIMDMPNDLIRKLMTFAARKARVIAVDIDDAVLENTFADESIVWELGKEIGVATASADLVSSHWVLEHVADVEEFADEVYRILRPRGWFAARTVNADSYVGWNRFVPTGAIRDFLLRRVAGQEPTQDKFPVQFKVNRPSVARRVFDERRFDTYVFRRRSTQNYATTGGAYYLFRLLNRIPVISYTDLIVFAQKKE